MQTSNSPQLATVEPAGDWGGRMTVRELLPHECEYRLAYSYNAPDPRHEAWVLDWMLEWLDCPSVLTTIYRTPRGPTIEVEITINVCEFNPTQRKRHQALLGRLDARVDDLRIERSARPAWFPFEP